MEEKKAELGNNTSQVWQRRRNNLNLITLGDNEGGDATLFIYLCTDFCNVTCLNHCFSTRGAGQG